jgi:hypothetical protein
MSVMKTCDKKILRKLNKECKKNEEKGEINNAKRSQHT